MAPPPLLPRWRSPREEEQHAQREEQEGRGGPPERPGDGPGNGADGGGRKVAVGGVHVEAECAAGRVWVPSVDKVGLEGEDGRDDAHSGDGRDPEQERHAAGHKEEEAGGGDEGGACGSAAAAGPARGTV